MTFTRQEFATLVRQANAGDPGAIAQLRRTLDANPDLWQQLGDLAAHAEASLLTLVAGADQLARESIARKLQSLREELGGSAPPLLERMAIDRVVISWLGVQHVDMLAGSTGTATAARANQIVKWQDQVSRRYNAAVKALLDVRRLLPQTSRSCGSPTQGLSNRPSLRVVGELEGYAKQAPTGT